MGRHRMVQFGAIKRVLRAGAFGLGLAMTSTVLSADDDVTKLHGYNFFGDLTYPSDFEHLSYVNPDAPKGGEMAIATSGTFDSLNPYSRKGRPGALTSLAYDRLLDGTSDTVGEYYGLIAHSLEYPEDRAWVIFNMRPEATFSDGSPVTAHDVVFSHELFIEQGLPSYSQAVGRMVTGVEALNDHQVKFSFNTDLTPRSRIETVGLTPIFSKAWLEADKERRLDEPRLEVAVGSGPWVLESYDINRRIVYQRRDDYWAKDLPINRGRHNFDTIRVEYFADTAAQFEAFKAGEYTFRVEADPKRWVSGYDFPKVKDGVVVREELNNGSPPTPSGFVFNMARPQLQDSTVREAIALAFNFEWTNESLLFGLNAPRDSFVEGTHLEATGIPEGAELEFLQSLGDVVPEAVLTSPARGVHTSKPGKLNDRRNMRTSSKLLDAAGWAVGTDGIRRNATGETLRVRMLIPSNISSSIEAIHETFVKNLRAVGVDASFEKIDPSQYTLRQRERDFDMLYSTRYDGFLSTGGGLSQMYGSKEAEFSLFNPAGLNSPLVDAIIEKSFTAQTQAETNTALTALDRALRHEFFIVPIGYVPVHWVARYDMFEHPENMPPYDLGTRDFWWYNAEKAEALKAAGVLR